MTNVYTVAAAGAGRSRKFIRQGHPAACSNDPDILIQNEVGEIRKAPIGLAADERSALNEI